MTEQTKTVSETKENEIPRTILKVALDIWDETGKQSLIPITGRSMLPLLRPGDHVTVEHGCLKIKRGEIIVFRQENKLVVHRVIRFDDTPNERVFVTKGDNVFYFDSPVAESQLVGRVSIVQRGEQRLFIDTTPWQIVGGLIAISTLAWTKLYRASRTLKQAVLGTQPNRLTAFLRQSALDSFSFMRRIIQIVLGR